MSKTTSVSGGVERVVSVGDVLYYRTGENFWVVVKVNEPKGSFRIDLLIKKSHLMRNLLLSTDDLFNFSVVVTRKELEEWLKNTEPAI